MFKRTTIAMILVAVCSLSTRLLAWPILPNPYISDWLRWVVPNHGIQIRADDESGTWINYWYWYYTSGVNLLNQDDTIGYDAYSVAEFSFDSAKHYQVEAYATNRYGVEHDYASVYVVNMTFAAEPAFNGYVAVNDDDDNENGVMDNQETAPLGVSDDDLARFDLGVYSQAFHYGDKVVLSVAPVEVAPDLQVWGGAGRTTLVLPYQGSYGREWGPTGGPSQVYIEGIYPSDGVEPYDPHLCWSYFGNRLGIWANLEGWNGCGGDSKWITVVHIDMDMDGVEDLDPLDAYFRGVTQEITPGGFVPVGGLVQLTVRKVEGTTLNPSVTLAATGATDKIKVWRNQNKTGPITFGTPFATNSELPIPLSVEGVETTSIRGITLALQCTLDGKTFEDRVRATVFKADRVCLSSGNAEQTPICYNAGYRECRSPCASSNPEPSLIIPHYNVRSSGDPGIVRDFTVTLDALLLPSALTLADFPASVRDGPKWFKISGPGSGYLDDITQLHAKYKNPKQGGVYELEFVLPGYETTRTRAFLHLPLAGADISAWLPGEVDGVVTYADYLREWRLLPITCNTHMVAFTLLAQTCDYSNCAEPRGCGWVDRQGLTMTAGGVVMRMAQLSNMMFGVLARGTADGDAQFYKYVAIAYGASYLPGHPIGSPDGPAQWAAYMAGRDLAKGESVLEVMTEHGYAMQEPDSLERKLWPSTRSYTGGISRPIWMDSTPGEFLAQIASKTKEGMGSFISGVFE